MHSSSICMNNLLTPSFLGLFLFLVACESPIPSTLTKKGVDSTAQSANVNVDSTPEPITTIQQELDQFEAKRGNKNRTIWQRPRMIIQQLGDLSDKVVADIGAGPYGYFSFQIAQNAKKVIAIDIDKSSLAFIDSMRMEILSPDKQEAIEVRLAEPNDPNLKNKEADVVILMNIYAYIPDHLTYLKKLSDGMKSNSRILIIDFKMRHLPIGPSQNEKIPLYIVERELVQAGFELNLVDDRSLDYQYMVIAKKKE